MAEIGKEAWAMTQIRSVRPPGFLVPRHFCVIAWEEGAGYEPRPVL